MLFRSLSICRVCVFVCILRWVVLAAAGNLEVISHTGAANNTRREMEHPPLLTQHSTFINKVRPLSIVRRREAPTYWTWSCLRCLCATALTAGTTGDLGHWSIASFGWSQAALNPPVSRSFTPRRKTGALLCTVTIKPLKGEFRPSAPRTHEPTSLSFQRDESRSRHVVFRGNAEAQPVFMQTLHLISAGLIKACSVALEKQKCPSD